MVTDDLAQLVRQFCSKHGLRLNTDLGQHFLIEPAVLDMIIVAATIEATDHVVEIGPGIGILTKELLQHARRVTAIELDQRMLPLLEKYVSMSPRPTSPSDRVRAGELHIVQGNALQIPMPGEPYIVVANIPYHITSPLLRHVFLESEVYPRSMTLLIQKEVAEKICDTRKSGMLTVLVGLFGTPTIVADVAPDCFLPPPKVDSAVLHIECFPKPLASKEILEHVFRLTKMSFGQKRKMLRNSIGKQPGGMELLEHTGIDPERRPETLSVQEWLVLAKHDTKS